MVVYQLAYGVKNPPDAKSSAYVIVAAWGMILIEDFPPFEEEFEYWMSCDRYTK